MERTGNFVDWSKQLMSIDSAIAKKQLDSFQKLLYKAASKYPVNGKQKDDPFLYLICTQLSYR